MNKIVLIGNGFDVAHGLPTRYSNFLDSVRDSIVIKIYTSTSSYRHEILGQSCKRDRSFIHKLDENGKEDPWLGAVINQKSHKIELRTNPHATNNSIYYKSLFSDKSLNGYWSDLEYHYFKTLNKNSANPKAISIINEEFEHLKTLLFLYLKNEVENKIGEDDGYISDNHSIFHMLSEGHNNFSFNKHFFVNFNYTSKIVNQYVTWLRQLKGKENIPLAVNIHGDLVNPSNPIIFGYGDDNSEEYKGLQNLKENSLLQNFKTFQYLRSSRYKQVLSLLETSTELYVQIIGHSCDITDKALLRTIFQHPNVQFIEGTYYESEGRYFEKLYNISRIFDDTSLMRQKIIPLEQSFMIV
nr:AbiH family protein [uncultured Psychroserpens sp.]